MQDFLSGRLAEIISIFIFCFVGASAQATGGEQPVEIKLEHDALGEAPTINVEIGGKVYQFLFDTGGGGITTVTPIIAKEIGCQPFG